MKKLVLAIQLMTRLPIKKQYDTTGKDYADSVVWFFFTSLMVGGVMLLMYYVFSFTAVPYLAAFLSVIAASLFTGGFHIDGFADMCDAFFARKPKERTLEILKDSRMGTYGVIAIVFVLLVKTLLIGSIPSTQILRVLLVMPVCGKIPMVFCATLSKYPRETGLGKYVIDLLSPGIAVLSIVLCGISVLLCVGIVAGMVAVGMMLLCGWLLSVLSKHKIGGATGDILGAANEMGEMLFLLIVVMLP